MKQVNGIEFTADQIAELDALDKLPEDQIDTSDAPEVRDWSGAKRGLFYQGHSAMRIVQLDPDLAEWFDAHGKQQENLQKQVNRTLREYVDQQMRKVG